ncbi:hypothetical protein KIN20_007226 [Parelaphostrongylus tenuis]|uniref:Uncharacterized protein n=1 Tax=Parelaphostrongylus tenuis TaxID=148309 RepID=A0AAD5QJV5_PARTN|nr:hypothetical protein KIN20_007226 [Parelaphostrongylus tenuis]
MGRSYVEKNSQQMDEKNCRADSTTMYTPSRTTINTSSGRHRAQLDDYPFLGADVTIISNGNKGNDLHLITVGSGRSSPWRAQEELNSNLRTVSPIRSLNSTVAIGQKE